MSRSEKSKGGIRRFFRGSRETTSDAKPERQRREFALEVLENVEEGHRQKLEQEQRVCGSCGYRILNPLTDRCPRCFTTVPPSQHTNCGECDYKGNCALAEVKRRG